MSLFLQDGLKWLENKSKKIKREIKNIKTKEGYRGIMGNIPSVDAVNNSDSDFTTTVTLTDNLAQGINTYNTKYDSLNTATKTYLGKTSEYGVDKNYNMFINTPMDFSKITATPYTKGVCVANGASSNNTLHGLTDAGVNFTAAYPNNFANTPTGAKEAINACKLWAADTQTYSSSSTNPTSTYFAVTKDTSDDPKFKCYTGNTLSGEPKQYTVKQVAYVLANSSDVDQGGFFSDGTFGVYNSKPTADADTSNPNNISTRFAAPLAGYEYCDKMVGGSLNPKSITATLGANCTNVTGKPVNIRFIRVNASGIPWMFIQISQLAVFAISNGVGMNVATSQNNNKAVATASSQYSWYTEPVRAIDGQLAARSYPYIFHSGSYGTEWWQLDLGQEYPVYQIDYYNREGCCQDRARGMTLQFKDGSGGNWDSAQLVQVKDPVSGANAPSLKFLSDAMKQTFMIAQAS